MKDTDVRTPVERVRKGFNAGITRPLAWRRDQLKRLRAMLVERESEIAEALHRDLRKSELESYLTEIGFLHNEIDHTLKHLGAWAKPEKVAATLAVQPGRALVVREPLGVILIIAPWNYPFQLLLSPMVGALAAGNAVVLKPSEITSHVADLVGRLIPEYLDPDAVAVVQGGVPETTGLLKERFDYIFYTGNGSVGQIIMEAAAKHLTPVTLELGGKSPVIVHRDADLDVTARRIVWGKYLNAGQTCVAPDYVLAHASIHDTLLDKIAESILLFYGESPQTSPDYARVVNARHHHRLVNLLEGQDIVVGGQHDVDDLYIAPTVLRNVSPNAPVMSDEIFGPILPVLKIESSDDAISFVNSRPKPLALYLFTQDAQVEATVFERTSAGGSCVNDVIVHLTCPDLPFGGVGASGMGAYHGRHSFEVFSHRRSVIKRPYILDVPLRYPPFSASKAKWLRRLARM